MCLKSGGIEHFNQRAISEISLCPFSVTNRASKEQFGALVACRGPSARAGVGTQCPLVQQKPVQAHSGVGAPDSLVHELMESGRECQDESIPAETLLSFELLALPYRHFFPFLFNDLRNIRPRLIKSQAKRRCMTSNAKGRPRKRGGFRM